MGKEYLTIEQVTNERLKANIEDLQAKTLQFFVLVAQQVDANLATYQRSTDWPQHVRTVIERSEGYDFENDGNTHTDGYEYVIRYIMPMCQDPKADPAYYRRRGIEDPKGLYCENVLFFEYTIRERVSDGRLSSPFVTLYYSRPSLTSYDTDPTSKGYHVVNNNPIQIDHNNDNYPLDSVINVRNAARCIEMITTDQERYKLIKLLNSMNKNPQVEGATPIIGMP